MTKVEAVLSDDDPRILRIEQGLREAYANGAIKVIDQMNMIRWHYPVKTIFGVERPSTLTGEGQKAADAMEVKRAEEKIRELANWAYTAYRDLEAMKKATIEYCRTHKNWNGLENISIVGIRVLQNKLMEFAGLAKADNGQYYVTSERYGLVRAQATVDYVKRVMAGNPDPTGGWPQ